MPGSLAGRLAITGLAFLAVLIQVQATFQSGTTAIRLNAADLALACLVPVFLAFLARHYNRLKPSVDAPTLLLIATVSVVLTISLVRGYMESELLSNWAVVRYAGWYAILYYLVAGVLIAITFDNRAINRFAMAFVGFQAALAIAFLTMIGMGRDWPIAEGGRFSGLIGNSNAMGLYLICGLSLALVCSGRTGISSRWRTAALVSAAILLAGVLFTKSIATFIGVICVLAFAALIKAASIKTLGKAIVLGLVIWGSLQAVSSTQSRTNIAQKIDRIVKEGTSTNKVDRGRYQASVQVRLDGYRDAIEIWQAHPVLGAGLGYYLQKQVAMGKSGKNLFRIHSTGLWLLAETGLAGFLAIVTLFCVLFRKVWMLAKNFSDGVDHSAWLPAAVLLIMFGWAVAALFGELMYQRAPWLLLGMALATPVGPMTLKRKNLA